MKTALVNTIQPMLHKSAQNKRRKTQSKSAAQDEVLASLQSLHGLKSFGVTGPAKPTAGSDWLKHFEKHGAFVKLLALFIPQIKYIVGPCGTIALAVVLFGSIRGWW